MSDTTPLNTTPITQFIQKTKSADMSKSKELKLSINEAKTLAYTLGMVMSRLEGDLEQLLTSKNTNEVIQVDVNGGEWR